MTVLVSALLATCALAAQNQMNSTGKNRGAAAGKGDPSELVRQVINHELEAEAHDQSHWMLVLRTLKPGGAKETDEVVETKDGDLKRPLLINGHNVPAGKANADLEKLAHDSDALHTSLKDKNEDSQRSQQMLKMLPEAFLFTYGQTRGELRQLKFSPNPKFKPSSHESEVFHAMQGSLWVDTKQLRVEEISGRLMHEVKFAAGLLGHLDPGGTFDVKQAQVAPGYWELTQLNVHMRGKALFFKTIAVQQQYSREQFKKVSDDLTAAQGVGLLEKQASNTRRK